VRVSTLCGHEPMPGHAAKLGRPIALFRVVFHVVRSSFDFQQRHSKLGDCNSLDCNHLFGGVNGQNLGYESLGLR